MRHYTPAFSLSRDFGAFWEPATTATVQPLIGRHGVHRLRRHVTTEERRGEEVRVRRRAPHLEDLSQALLTLLVLRKVTRWRGVWSLAS